MRLMVRFLRLGLRCAISAVVLTSTKIAQRQEGPLLCLARAEVVTEAMAGGVHLAVVVVLVVVLSLIHI